MRGGAAGAGKRGMAAHGAVTSGCGGAVKTTHLRAERSRAHKPRKRHSRFEFNAGVAAACAKKENVPQRPAASGSALDRRARG